jgi:hypothetical protein
MYVVLSVASRKLLWKNFSKELDRTHFVSEKFERVDLRVRGRLG